MKKDFISSIVKILVFLICLACTFTHATAVSLSPTETLAQIQSHYNEARRFTCDEKVTTSECREKLSLYKAYFENAKLQAQLKIKEGNALFISTIRTNLYHFIWESSSNVAYLRKLKRDSLVYQQQKRVAEQGLEIVSRYFDLSTANISQHLEEIDIKRADHRLATLENLKTTLAKEIDALNSHYRRTADRFFVKEYLLLKHSLINLQISVIQVKQDILTEVDHKDRVNLAAQANLLRVNLNNLTERFYSLTRLNQEFTHSDSSELSKQTAAAIANIDHYISERLVMLQKQISVIHARTLPNKLLLQSSVKEPLTASIPSLGALLHDLLTLAPAFLNYCYGLLLLFLEAWRHISFTSKSAIVVSINLMVAIYFFGKRHIKRLCRRNYVNNGLIEPHIVCLRVIGKSWGYICFMVLFVSLMSITKVAFHSYEVIIWIAVIASVYLSIMKLTKISLFESQNNRLGHDVQLYLRLKTTLAVGFALAIGDLVSHFLCFQGEVQRFFDFLFMGFLFFISLLLLRSRQVIFQILFDHLKPVKSYVIRALSIAVFLVPTCICINGIIGILGYVKFAWQLAHYQSLIITLFILFVLAKGVVNELFDYVATKFIDQLSHGWLWNQAVLKPIHRLTHYFLLGVAIYIALFWLGITQDNKTILKLDQLWSYRLFNMSGMHISVHSVIYFILVLIVLIWISRWLREFCFRWFYKNVGDVALRNSLAVLSHYTVVVLGFIFTLNVLGIDISGITYILGGLAVGMGLGLRDFANNIVGGLMLLIERPVKEGDLITVDDIEGRVVHIGLRSMRVCSWDNDEVLVPNADTFSKPFTNWTYKDSIVRTVVPIKVHRFDSPVKVKQLILDVLAIIPEVLDEPEPKVYLKEIDDTLLAFEIRYYIDIDKNSRTKVRSLVLFAIMAQFKAAGIKAPIPSFAVHQPIDHDSQATTDS